MSREWKPGDVATARVTTRGNERRRIQRTDNAAHPWQVHDEIGGLVSASVVVEIEPVSLVTIDPDDREQVERLLVTYHAQYPVAWSNDSDAVHVGHMQSALREFANPTPPKPDEPTGLGAVVEDANGKRYIRCDAGPGRWHCPDDDTGASDDFYANINAVRVLSEGVS